VRVARLLEALAELSGQRAGEERREFRCGDEVAAVGGETSELGGAGGVLAEAGRVQGQFHEAIERQPAAGRVDGVGKMCREAARVFERVRLRNG